MGWGIFNKLKDTFNKVVDKGKEVWNNTIKPGLQQGAQFVKDKLPGIVDAAGNFLTSIGKGQSKDKLEKINGYLQQGADGVNKYIPKEPIQKV